MKTQAVLVLCSVLLFFSVIPALVTGNNIESMDERFLKLQDDFFDWRLKTNPHIGQVADNDKYNHLLLDLSLSALDTNKKAVQNFLNEAKRIDRGQLTQLNQRYNYDVLIDMLNTYCNGYTWREYGPLNVVNYDSSPGNIDVIYRMNLATQKDFNDYVQRLEALPTQFAQIKARMGKAVSLGTTNHMISMVGVTCKLSQIYSVNWQESEYFLILNESLESASFIPSIDREHFRNRAKSATKQILTSIADLTTFIDGTYLPSTRTTYGLYGLPNGKNYYHACLMWHLTIDMTPNEVHNKGLMEVERISQLMNQIIRRHNFGESIAEFYRTLDADPRFYFNTPDEIREGYEDIIFSRITPKLSTFFHNISNRSVQVEQMSFEGALGFYNPKSGTFYFNGVRPSETKTFSMMSLALHETVPGHHLQKSHEADMNLPLFRQYRDANLEFAIPYVFPFYSSYVEGWGLYAEYLGEEMGLYKNDLEMMGRYGGEMLRACRLVVDTGLHYKQWTREEAIRYMSERVPFSQTMIEREVDRYINLPGQACSYKIGELKIKELRRKAEIFLGDKFDIRDFHSVLLEGGPVPLKVMETMVNAYIERTKG